MTEMNKHYQSPTMKVVKVNARQMLCTSPGATTSDLAFDPNEYSF